MSASAPGSQRASGSFGITREHLITEAPGAASPLDPIDPPAIPKTRITALQFLSYCVPLVGLALANHKTHRIHLAYFAEPAVVRQGEVSVITPPSMQSSVDVSMCATACVINVVCTGIILFLYLPTAIFFPYAWGVCALTASQYVATATEAAHSAYMISTGTSGSLQGSSLVIANGSRAP